MATDDESDRAIALIERTWKRGIVEPGTIELSLIEASLIEAGPSGQLASVLRDAIDKWVALVRDEKCTVTWAVRYGKSEWLISLYAESEGDAEHWQLRASPRGGATAQDLGVIVGFLFVATTLSAESGKVTFLDDTSDWILTVERSIEFCWHSDTAECPLTNALRAERARLHETMDKAKPSPVSSASKRVLN